MDAFWPKTVLFKLTVSDRQKSGRSFVSGSNARIIKGVSKVVLLPFWRDVRAEVEPEILLTDVATEELDRRWYEAITGRMPIGWHLAAVCYATVAILLGWWPWNFLLLPFLFSIRRKRARFYEFPAIHSSRPMRPNASCARGSSL